MLDNRPTDLLSQEEQHDFCHKVPLDSCFLKKKKERERDAGDTETKREIENGEGIKIKGDRES